MYRGCKCLWFDVEKETDDTYKKEKRKKEKNNRNDV